MDGVPVSATPEDGRDQALIAAHRAGDQAALGALLRGYQHRVFAVCVRMVTNRDDAAELTQDALMRVIQGLDRYRGEAAFGTWVYRVAMNICLSHLRRVGRRAELATRQPLRRTRELPADPAVELDERRARLVAALAELDADMRAVIVLRDLNDLEYEQIGDVLEIPMGTVKSRLFRARTKLRDLLEEAEDAAESSSSVSRSVLPATDPATGPSAGPVPGSKPTHPTSHPPRPRPA